MIKIDINNQENVILKLYPDNQPHIQLPYIEEGQTAHVHCSIVDSSKLLQLLMVSDALDNSGSVKSELHIPYLMGARFDRIMEPGDSFDLKVIAKLINSCGFKKVFLYDVHSDVSAALIENSVLIKNDKLVQYYNQKDAILICPDAGAAKKIGHYLKINPNISDVVYCTKQRNLSNGNLTIKVIEPGKCYNKNCVIIDDLCDGGGTFLGIASQIQPKHLTLIITHGIFSKGLHDLEKSFDSIIVTDTYPQSIDSDTTKIIKYTNLI